jgi:exosortase
MQLTLHSQLTWNNRLLLAIKIIPIIAATMALFFQDLMLVFTDALQSETTSHILAIPILFAYLIIRKRKMLRAVAPLQNQNEPRNTRYLSPVIGLLLCTTAILLYWHGSYTFTPIEYHMIALPIFLAGLILIVFNPQTLRQLAFPIAFLAFLTPPPSEILYNAGATLQFFSAEASNAIVNLFRMPTTFTNVDGSPTIILTRPDSTTLTFTVDIACSGIYSLIGFLIFIVFVAYITRDKPWKKAVLILIGLPLVYLLNILRITIMIIMGYYYGEDLALQTFHLLGGWFLIFLGTLILLVISEKIFKTQIFAPTAEKCPQCNLFGQQQSSSFCTECGRILKAGLIKLSKTDIAKLAAITISVTLLLSVQAPLFAMNSNQVQASDNRPMIVVNTSSGTQTHEFLPDENTSEYVRSANYSLNFLYRDTAFEAKAKQDMSLIYTYSPLNATDPASNRTEYFIWATIEIGTATSSLHRWETCLITWPLTHGSQAKAVQIELKDIQLTENPLILSRYFVFNQTATNETQAVLYWYESATFTTNGTGQQKKMKISLITYPESIGDIPEIETQLTALAKAITDYWQPIKTWSQITLIISQQGANLATGTTVLIAAITIFILFKTRRQRKANQKTLQKLSETNKQMIDSIRKAEEKALPTLNNIARTHQEATGQQISEQQLLDKLAELEKTGTVKSTIASQNDEPIQTWKTHLF